MCITIKFVEIFYLFYQNVESSNPQTINFDLKRAEKCLKSRGKNEISNQDEKIEKDAIQILFETKDSPINAVNKPLPTGIQKIPKIFHTIWFDFGKGPEVLPNYVKNM
jgi:hypothetical protein